jgi:pyruvate kinase
MADLEADYVAVSFPAKAGDMVRARTLLHKAGGRAALMAKIERIEAIENLEEICDVSDAILVARGDLGVEIGDAELPGLQKRIIQTALKHNRIVVTATQMMQSMIEHPIPTRAEVLDVANAVMDGSDGVMLSAETAMGKHPARVVEAMHRICLGAERHFDRENRPGNCHGRDVHGKECFSPGHCRIDGIRLNCPMAFPGPVVCTDICAVTKCRQSSPHGHVS